MSNKPRIPEFSALRLRLYRRSCPEPKNPGPKSGDGQKLGLSNWKELRHQTRRRDRQFGYRARRPHRRKGIGEKLGHLVAYQSCEFGQCADRDCHIGRNTTVRRGSALGDRFHLPDYAVV